MGNIMLIGQIIQKDYIGSVDLLKDTMEQYVNYGFHVIEKKIKSNLSYFYKNTDFLDAFFDLLVPPSNSNDVEIEENTLIILS